MISSWEPGTWPAPHVLYGGDYNPEQWSPPVWREDAALMRKAGVNLATVGVFSWARLEPAPGEYDFGWLAEVLDLLYDAGVGVALGTPTASPPPWLTVAHPDVLPVERVRRAVLARQPAALLRAPSRVPGARAAHRVRAGPAARRSPGHPDLARAQRVRLPRPAVLLRRLGRGVPDLAARALRHRRGDERGLGRVVLEPALPRLRRGAAAAGGARAAQPRPPPGLPPVLQRLLPGPLSRRAGPAPLGRPATCR